METPMQDSKNDKYPTFSLLLIIGMFALFTVYGSVFRDLPNPKNVMFALPLTVIATLLAVLIAAIGRFAFKKMFARVLLLSLCFVSLPLAGLLIASEQYLSTKYNNFFTMIRQEPTAYPRNEEQLIEYTVGFVKKVPYIYEQLLEAVEKSPTDAFNYYVRGRYHSSLLMHDLAIKDYSKAITLEPGLAVAYASRAADHLFLRNIDNALADSTKAIELNPEMPQPYLTRSAAHLKLQKTNEALADLRKAADLGSKTATESLNEFDLRARKPADNVYPPSLEGLERLRDWAAAKMDYTLEEINQSIALWPERPDYYFSRGLLYCSKGMFREALADYTVNAALEPDSYAIYSFRGALYHQLGEPGKAIDDFTKVIALKPDLSETYRLRAQVYTILDQHENALADMEQAAKRGDPVAMEHLREKNQDPKDGEELREIEKLTQAIADDPENAELYFKRGLSYGLLEPPQHHKTLADFRKAMELNPDEPVYFTLRQMIFSKLGMYDKTLADCNKLIELDPGNADAYWHRAIAYAYLGGRNDSLADMRQAARLGHEEAIKLLKEGNVSLEPQAAPKESRRSEPVDPELAKLNRAIENAPWMADNFFRRGDYYASKDMHDKAVADYSKAIELGPIWEGYYVGRAKVYAQQNEFLKAFDDCTKAIALDPAAVDAYMVRAHVNKVLGKAAAAQQDMKQAARLGDKKAQAILTGKSISWE